MFTLAQAQAMAAAAPGPSACFDEGGACTFVNRAWTSLTGLDAESARGRGWFAAIYKDDRTAAHIAWQSFIDVEVYPERIPQPPVLTIELRLVQLASQQPRWIRMQAGHLIGRQGVLVGFFGQFVDVHDLHEARRILEERAQLLEMSDALMHLGHWHVYSGTGEVYWSDELHRLHGTQSGVFRPRLANAVSAYHPEDRQEVEKVVGGVVNDGEPYTTEARLVRTDGEMRHVRLASVPWRSENGGPDVIGVCQDVTEQVAALRELEARTGDLQRSNAELARFAAVASHDLKEPLRRIRTFCDLIEEDNSSVEEALTSYIPRIKASAERLHRMVGELLELARVTAVAKSRHRVDLGRVLRRVHESFADTLGTDAIFHCGPLPFVHANETQMEQVFSNLVGNSIKYADPNRPLEISVLSVVSPERGWIRIEIEDNGIGFEPEQAQRIFNLFERLHAHDAYPGTGLGLALCQRVIEEHGGRILAQGRPGLGAKFCIELPEIPDEQKGAGHGTSTTDLHL